MDRIQSAVMRLSDTTFRPEFHITSLPPNVQSQLSRTLFPVYAVPVRLQQPLVFDMKVDFPSYEFPEAEFVVDNEPGIGKRAIAVRYSFQSAAMKIGWAWELYQDMLLRRKIFRSADVVLYDWSFVAGRYGVHIPPSSETKYIINTRIQVLAVVPGESAYFENLITPARDSFNKEKIRKQFPLEQMKLENPYKPERNV